MTQTNENKALYHFRTGHNCAQSVLMAFEKLTGENGAFAHQLASGFGGGMGRLQLTCGAVTGAVMAIGLHNSISIADEATRKQTTNSMIQRFCQRFEENHGNLSCSGLLGHDLNTDNGRAEIARRGLTEKICAPCVSDAVSILIDLGVGG